MKIKARIKLYSGSGKRKTPFASEYQPIFNLASDFMTSGKIILLDDKNLIYPGEEADAKIYFLDDDKLKQYFTVGSILYFHEGSYTNMLGEAEVLEIL
jgi:hypothetical protein